MVILWSAEAVGDLQSLRAYIAQDNPAAAGRMVFRVVEAVETLLPEDPALGRPGRVPGTRELVMAKTPYVVPYRIRNRTVEIIRVYHGAQKWPENL
jgi:toxin ParE1/3/4